VFKSRRVVVAAGILPFAVRPDTFSGLPPALVSHASEEKNLKRFAGKHVAVVGAGQSALESAVLLKERGAQVQVIVRDEAVRWLQQKPWLHKWPLKPMLYAWPDVGPALVSHLVAKPNVFRRLPRDMQDRLAPRAIRPAGAAWVKDRFDFKNIPIRTGQFVVKAVTERDRLKLTLNDRSEHVVDHVLLGTGYRVDISRYSFLSRKLLECVNQVNGYPKLDEGFESTLPGLHFLGAPAAWSFGPLMRFVAGTEFVARGLAWRVAKQH
jgi:pyruvate/2-oxoglutarate dehydrogenase complex dihydrolipoamide dehydrogenase (E3) component